MLRFEFEPLILYKFTEFELDMQNICVEKFVESMESFGKKDFLESYVYDLVYQTLKEDKFGDAFFTGEGEYVKLPGVAYNGKITIEAPLRLKNRL